ncbi:MAG: hypothetical protein KBT87_14770 [Gammaproteobacteria bacterium]|nr:hypothetical protein [Gammaproteobacteria bacterium]
MANIFTFILGTEQFVTYIREKLVSIVISKDFVSNLNQDEQRNLLKMVLKPAKELSAMYSGITSYFDQYVDDSMKLFDSTYRGHMRIDAVASYDEERECMQVLMEVDYIVYKISDKFEPIILGLEDASSEHLETIIRGSGNMEELLTNEHAENIDSEDPTMNQMLELKIPEKFNTLSHINVSRKIIERGSDHWQSFSYKTAKACDQVTISLRCEEDVKVKSCNTYGVQSKYSIEKTESRVKVTYNDWLSPGFGVNIIVAKKDWHKNISNNQIQPTPKDGATD